MNIWTKLAYAMVVLHGDEWVPRTRTKITNKNKSKYFFWNIAVYIYNLKDTNTKKRLEIWELYSP